MRQKLRKLIEKPGKLVNRVNLTGEESFQALNSKIYRKNVKLDVMDIDKYRRLVCIVYLNGTVINQEMIAEGWAWAYRKYLALPYSSEYIRLEDQARS